MTILFSWLWSPIGRTITAIGALFAAALAIYLKGRAEGIEALRLEQLEHNERRLRDALENEDRVRRDIARDGGLLKDDGFRRD